MSSIIPLTFESYHSLNSSTGKLYGLESISTFKGVSTVPHVPAHEAVSQHNGIIIESPLTGSRQVFACFMPGFLDMNIDIGLIHYNLEQEWPRKTQKITKAASTEMVTFSRTISNGCPRPTSSPV